jgi:hypothetical protein
MTVLPLSIDRHTMALISIVGSVLDVLGGLYLAYDLLGGEHGPLRTLTRTVTYAVLYGTAFGLALGPVFGVMSGLGHGITLGWEFSRASRNEPRASPWMDVGMSAIRGIGFALGTAYLFGPVFGICFGTASTVAQSIAYRFGIRPDADYQPGTRPRVTRFQMLAAANRTFGYAMTGYICSLIAHQRDHALAVGLRAGLAIGLATAVVGTFTPFVEYAADHVPEKRLGALGICLIVVGFSLQSLQYWAVFLDVNLR